MKKTLLACALLLWGAVGVGVIWNLERARQVSAAQLVPAEALLVAEFPNLPSSAMRWKGTALSEILSEPELRAFLSKPVAGMAPGADLPDALERLKRAQPRQAFLAVASLEENQPHAVAGLEFTGDRRELEPLISQALIRAQNASPQGGIRRLHYRGYRLLTFNDRGITLVGCFAKNWYFVANDVELLKATLDRLSGSGHPSLAKTAAYQVSQLALPPRADFRLFVQSPAPANRLLARFIAQPSAAQGPKFASAALATRIEGALLHDTLVIRLRGTPARVPSLNGRTLALTTSDTLFYGAMAPQLESWLGSSASGANRLIPTLMAALTPTGKPDLARFQAAFGPEHALILDWPHPSPQPDLFLASEIRDAAQARRFTEALLKRWDREDAGGVPIWTFSLAQPALFHPAVALAGSHMVAGLSSERLRPFALHAIRQPAGGQGETLERSPVFRSSVALLARPETALAYLDAAALFERIYTSLRPAAAIWGPGIPWLSAYADFDRLPSPQAISRHLSPITLSAHQAEEGIVIDTAGPVSFVELAAGLGLGAFYAAVPALKPTNPNPQSILPPAPPKPLSAPADPTDP
ncbi:MAG: hypothetical protein ACFUZC_18020 [Chthoniobacteraceae bacterium]